MFQQHKQFEFKQNVIVAGYVRRSSEMQKDNYSIDAQKRAIRDSCKIRALPEPIFYEDDERSARGEQIAKRPAFKQLLDDVQEGKVQVILVHTLDRWSRNVMVTLQSFRILSECQTAFISLSEHIDYSTPEGRLQLTILSAFAAYFPICLPNIPVKAKASEQLRDSTMGMCHLAMIGQAQKPPQQLIPRSTRDFG